MKQLTENKKLFTLLVSILAIAVIYVLMITVIPNMSIWSIPRTINSEECTVSLSDKKVYEQEFEMPFSRICSVGIPLDTNGADYVVSVDATLSIIDPQGNLIAEKKISSAYDTTGKFSYVDVGWGETYTLRLSVNSIGGGKNVEHIPLLKTDSDGNIVFKLNGLTGSSSEGIVFAIAYLIVAFLFVVYIYNLDIEKIGECRKADIALIGCLIVIAALAVCQFNDLYDISTSSLKILDSFRHGDVFNYSDHIYFEGLKEQSASQSMSCDYNFSILILCSIFLLPVYAIYGAGITYNSGGYAAVYSLMFVVAACLILSVWLIKGITRECGMDDRYLSNVRMLFITSSALLYMTVTFGQIDIMYIVVIILALPFYFRKKYLLFSLIMSLAVAMKSLPIMIFIPLILLANKKVRDIVINFAVVLVFPVVIKLLFGGGIGKDIFLAQNDEVYGYIQRLCNMKIGDTIALFILAFALICIAAFMCKTDTDNKADMLKKSMLVIFVTYCSFAAFVDWHAQWLIPLALSFSFLLPFYDNKKELLLLSAASEALFILTTNASGVSTYMINYGIIPPIVRQNYGGTSMKVILGNISPIAVIAIRTLLVAVLAYLVWYFVRNREKGSESKECPRQWVVGRLGVLSAFLVFYCWCFSYIG